MQNEQVTMRNVGNLDIIITYFSQKIKGLFQRAQSEEESGGLETSSIFLYLLY